MEDNQADGSFSISCHLTSAALYWFSARHLGDRSSFTLRDKRNRTVWPCNQSILLRSAYLQHTDQTLCDHTPNQRQTGMESRPCVPGTRIATCHGGTVPLSPQHQQVKIVVSVPQPCDILLLALSPTIIRQIPPSSANSHVAATKSASLNHHLTPRDKLDSCPLATHALQWRWRPHSFRVKTQHQQPPLLPPTPPLQTVGPRRPRSSTSPSASPSQVWRCSSFCARSASASVDDTVERTPRFPSLRSARRRTACRRSHRRTSPSRPSPRRQSRVTTAARTGMLPARSRVRACWRTRRPRVWQRCRSRTRTRARDMEAGMGRDKGTASSSNSSIRRGHSKSAMVLRNGLPARPARRWGCQ